MTYTVGDPGHVKAHSDLVSSINVELARFSMGGALPIKEEGAEGHLDDHNAIRAKLDELATVAGQSFSTPLPPVRQLGDGSHTDDHNTLALCVSEVATWPAWNAASGGIEQSIGNYNGTGERWMVHTFTGNGTLEVSRATQEFRYLVVAGGNGANYYPGTYANGGEVLEGTSTLGVNNYSVTVGAGGSGGQNNATSGGVSIFGPFTAAAGRTTTQVTSDISGVAHTGYGGNGNNPIAKGRGGVGQANSGTAGQNGVVIVAYRIS